MKEFVKKHGIAFAAGAAAGLLAGAFIPVAPGQHLAFWVNEKLSGLFKGKA